METTNTIFSVTAGFNWTVANLLLAVLAIFFVEFLRIQGRQSAPEVKRTKFEFFRWLKQFANWGSIAMSFFAALILFTIKDTVAADMDINAYAIMVGGGGQLLLKVALKALLGSVGAFSAPDAPVGAQ